MENEKFTLTEIFIRQINSFVICLVNALLSRNFCQKSVRVNFRNFHTVRFTVREFHNFSITQILREINFAYARSVKSAILRILRLLVLILAVYELPVSRKLISRKI